MDNNINIDETMTLMVDVTNSSLEQIEELPLGSKERASEVENAVKLLDRTAKFIEQTNKAAELQIKIDNDEIQREIEKKRQTREMWSGVGKTVLHVMEFAAGTALAIYSVNAPLRAYENFGKAVLKYEEKGSVISAFGRAHVNKAGSLLNFKAK